MMFALITLKPRGIVAVFETIPNPLKLPNGDQVAGAGLDWSSGGYAVVAVVPFAPGAGEIATGAPSYNVDQAGAVREIRATAPAPAPTVTAVEFRALFTPAETEAITTAGQSDVNIRIFMDDAGAADAIDLGSAKVARGLGYLVALKLLTAERAAAIAAGTAPAL